MDRRSFLAVSPRELDAWFEQIELCDRAAYGPAALICSVVANVNRDPEKKREPWTIEDFMPGDHESDEDNMRAFAEKVARGESFADDPDALKGMQGLKNEIKSRFKNLKTRTNLIAGEDLHDPNKRGLR